MGLRTSFDTGAAVQDESMNARNIAKLGLTDCFISYLAIPTSRTLVFQVYQAVEKRLKSFQDLSS
jgi:hypothetical protein